MNNIKEIDLVELYKLAEANTIKLLEGTIARYIAEILMNTHKSDLTLAEEWINNAIRTDSANHMTRWHLARDYELKGRILLCKGEMQEAQSILAASLEIFEQCGAHDWARLYGDRWAGNTVTVIA
jgi:hypothetical protein